MSTSTTNPHHEGNPEIVFEQPQDGPKRMIIKPQKLSIVWGKDIRYWNVPADGPAELYQVSWLEVTGCVSKTDPEKDYELGFNISLTPDAFGWSGSPVYILVKRGKTGKFKGHKFNIEARKGSDAQGFDITAKTAKIENAAETDAVTKEENTKVYFGLYEVWRGKWKGGLKINHAFIQPL